MYTIIMIIVAATSAKETPMSASALEINNTIPIMSNRGQFANAQATNATYPAHAATVANSSKAVITKSMFSVTQFQPATKRLKSHKAIWPIANIAVSKPAMKFCPAVLLINSCHA